MKSKLECDEKNEELYVLCDKLETLKFTAQEREAEYQMRQKQVTTYLQCRKSFFGRIRYFFKGKKKVKEEKEEIILNKRVKHENNKQEFIYDNKEYYTIEDLIDITKVLERTINQIKNARLDIKALEQSIERLDKRIANAKSYIDEIEEHKKSIFEFWKFVSKDEAPGLNEPEKEEVITRQIEKTFDYDEDLEEIGKKLDKKNREELSNEECDSLFIANTDVLEDINILKNEEKEDFTEHIEKIKKEALSEEMLFSSEEFDIFGGITEDKTKLNTLGNTKHREIKKSKFRILEINKNTKNEDYIENLKDITKNLDNAIDKAKFGMKLNGFCAIDGIITGQRFNILYIRPEEALASLKTLDKINLYKIKLNERTKAIALTNIVYYENNNRTLPIGMDISDKILVDISKLKLEPKKQKLFRLKQEINELEVNTKIVSVYEYDVV